MSLLELRGVSRIFHGKAQWLGPFRVRVLFGADSQRSLRCPTGKVFRESFQATPRWHRHPNVTRGIRAESYCESVIGRLRRARECMWLDRVQRQRTVRKPLPERARPMRTIHKRPGLLSRIQSRVPQVCQTYSGIIIGGCRATQTYRRSRSC